ncbi:Mitochondrial inner membrane protein oxa1l [Chytridiales sp. JEL 0842]|nr:Mitochondrial inner membrane protein oxa1l [Chytridiales sp. JEL 0842]
MALNQLCIRGSGLSCRSALLTPRKLASTRLTASPLISARLLSSSSPSFNKPNLPLINANRPSRWRQSPSFRSVLGLTSSRSFFWSSNQQSTKAAAASDAASKTNLAVAETTAAPAPSITSTTSTSQSDIVNSTPASSTSSEVIASTTTSPATPIVDPTISTEFTQNLNTVLTPETIAQAEPVTATLTAITQMGDFKLLGLCANTPVGLVERIMEIVYLNTGLPWWGTILATTMLFRFALLPAVIKSQRAVANLANLKPLSQPIHDEIARAKAAKDFVAQREAQTKLLKLFSTHNVSPFGAVWGLVQAPVFISFFLSLRKMAELPMPGFETGGLFWFTDLTVADPTWVLPIAASASMFAVMEFATETNAAQSQSAAMKNVFRFMMIVFIPLTATLPTAVFLYWISSNLFTLAQFYILKQPKVREYLKIPQLRKDVPKPIAGMAAVKPIRMSDAFTMAKEAAKEHKAAMAAVGKKA